jgi:hypothetical protein
MDRPEIYVPLGNEVAHAVSGFPLRRVLSKRTSHPGRSAPRHPAIRARITSTAEDVFAG